MIWVFLALIATFVWAWANILDKVLRTKFLKSSIALIASFGIFGIFFDILLFIFVGIPSIPFWHLIAAFIAGILLTCGLILYFKALSVEEASRVVPLWHLKSVFTLIFAVIFLNEMLTPLRYAAFASMLLGGFLISTRRAGNTFHLSPAIGFMLLSSILLSICEVLVKFAYTSEIFWQTFFVFHLGLTLSSLSLFIFSSVRKNVLRAVVSYKYVFVSILFLNILLGFSGQILFNKAISLGPVTLVSVFISFQSLFVLLIATFLSLKFPLFVKESIDIKTIGIKLVAIALMAFGLFLLSL